MTNITITAYTHSWGAYSIGPYLFFAFKATAVLLIGDFCSANEPLILISSCVPWCTNQQINGVCQELTPPTTVLQYILLISFHANFR